MLKNQMDKMEVMAGEQGLVSSNQRAAAIIKEKTRKEKEFDGIIAKVLADSQKKRER